MLHNKSGCKSLARPGSTYITLKKVELKKLDDKGYKIGYILHFVQTPILIQRRKYS